MADSAEQQTTNAALPRSMTRVLKWTAGQVFGLVFTSILAGTGGLYLMVEAGFLVTNKQMTELESKIKEMGGKIDGAHTKLANVTRELNDIDSTLQTSVNMFVQAERDRESKHQDQRKDVEFLGNLTTKLIDDTARGLRDLERNVTEKTGVAEHNILAKQIETTEGLREQVRELSGQLAAVHSAFVERLNELAEEGSALIEEGDLTKIGRWIEKANYMVRSLAIPTEGGLLRNTAAVNNDLREAMEGFDKERDEEAKMAHAQKALVIVEAVRELAVGGRIP